MMKKINLVATKHITIEKFFLPLIHSYINNDFELTIICNHSDKIKKILDKKYKSQINYLDFSLPVTIISLINPYLFFLKIIQIHRYLKKNDVKIIHINTPIASHFFRIANIFLKNKIIYHVHGFRFHKKGNFFKNQFNFLIEYFLSFKTDVYIAINNEDYNIINKFFKRKSFLIQGLGINLENINKYLSLKKNNFDKKINIGVIGAYKIEKGYKDIIDLAKILIKDKNIIINCYGYGNLSYYLNIKDKYKLENLNFNKHVDDIYKKIIDFDLLIHPSRREGLSVCILESMALNVPVITTTIRGCEDLIKDNFNGKLYNPGDINKLYSLVLEFISNKNDFMEYANISKNIIKNEYDDKIITEKISDVIKSL